MLKRERKRESERIEQTVSGLNFEGWLGETAYFIHKFIDSVEGIHNSKVPCLCLVRGARYLDGIFTCEYLWGGSEGRERRERKAKGGRRKKEEAREE